MADELTLTERALVDVFAERGRQDEAWGDTDHEDGLWCTILTKEVGEAAAAALAVWGASPTPASREYHEADLRSELVQVAAVAVAWIEALDRRKRGSNA